MLKHVLLLLIAFSLTLTVVGQQTSTSLPTKNTYGVLPVDTKEEIILKAAHVVPTANQYQALKNEFIAFIHFGPNTFTRLEWGTGKEDPQIFALQQLDTDQWCRAMKAAGMRMVIFTAKHHDGFVLWQSRYTKHGIMSCPYKNGKGDVLKELSASCKKYGLKLGVYLSPADLYQIESSEGLYGNLSKATERVIPRPIAGRPFANKTNFKFKVDDYNEYFLNQLFELLTEYGTIHEVWFDGAHPKRKGNQQYNYIAWKKLIQTLAPQAVIFGKQDIRWCGNEAGRTRHTEWNIIPYPAYPDTMNSFDDLTDQSLGSREDLYKGKFLHYQQAETNTSIREGWFYRDETDQKTRSTDDVFDIYERSVGGNSTFLLNIPPNREGKFSPTDIKILEEVGQRIRETYGLNIFNNAKAHPKLLDNNDGTYLVLNKTGGEIIIQTPNTVTINRLMLQEAIQTHGERVEQHALDAWINGTWKEIATASNIGYKRILRFPEVRSDKFRIRIIQVRDVPAISNIAAFYYKSRPPQLDIKANIDGLVSIAPRQSIFNWNPNGENPAANINTGITIRYTTDGSDPGATSPQYTKPFMPDGGEVKAAAFIKNERGSIVTETIGIAKKRWTLLAVSSQEQKKPATNAFDADSKTYWASKESEDRQHIAIDLGKMYTLKGFSYTPQTYNGMGMIEKGAIMVSDDKLNWKLVTSFEFGNLINDPSKRRFYFTSPVITQYIKIVATHIAGSGKNATVAELDFF